MRGEQLADLGAARRDIDDAVRVRRNQAMISASSGVESGVSGEGFKETCAAGRQRRREFPGGCQQPKNSTA